MTYDALLQYLRNLKATHGALEQFATLSGVPYHTLLKIVSGETKDPGIRTVEKLQLAALHRDGACIAVAPQPTFCNSQ